MGNSQDQAALLKDGVSQTPLKGQSDKIVNVGNPSGMPDLKSLRHTGENPAGTAFLRARMHGTDSSMESN